MWVEAVRAAPTLWQQHHSSPVPRLQHASRAVIINSLHQPPHQVTLCLVYDFSTCIGHTQNGKEPPCYSFEFDRLCIYGVSVLCAKFEVGLHADTRDVLLTWQIHMKGAVCTVDREGSKRLRCKVAYTSCAHVSTPELCCDLCLIYTPPLSVACHVWTVIAFT